MDMQLHRYRSAFLLGKEIDRVVYLTPPTEFEKKDIVWKLNTCIYGLSDASRNWYSRVKEELDKLGVNLVVLNRHYFFGISRMNYKAYLLHMQMIFVGVVPKILNKL